MNLKSLALKKLKHGSLHSTMFLQVDWEALQLAVVAQVLVLALNMHVEGWEPPQAPLPISEEARLSQAPLPINEAAHQALHGLRHGLLTPPSTCPRKRPYCRNWMI